MDSIPLKQCSRKDNCVNPNGQWLPATPEFFNRASKEKDGLKHACKACIAADRVRDNEQIRKQQARWYEENKEYALEKAKDYYESNREQVIDRVKRYYQENKEARIAYISQWASDNREKVNGYRRAHYLKYKDKMIAYGKRHRMANPERYKEYGRTSYYRHYEKHRLKNKVSKAKYRARIANAPGTHTAADIRALYEEQQGKCAYCGIRLFDEYHVDHVQPISRGGSNGLENLLLACPECNLSKNDKTLDEWKAIRGW